MRFEPDNDYEEVSLIEGLNKIFQDATLKLYSDGLEENEYMYHRTGHGICYEDDCVIGYHPEMAIERLSHYNWIKSHKFYVKRKEQQNAEV